jgi:hypothetical protein
MIPAEPNRVVEPTEERGPEESPAARAAREWWLRWLMLTAVLLNVGCTATGNRPGVAPPPDRDLGRIRIAHVTSPYVGDVDAVQRDPALQAGTGAMAGAGAGAGSMLVGPCLLLLAIPGGIPPCLALMGGAGAVGAGAGAVIGAAAEGPSDDPEMVEYINFALEEAARAVPERLAARIIETDRALNPAPRFTMRGDADTELRVSVNELSLRRLLDRERAVQMHLLVSAQFVDVVTGETVYRLVEVQQSNTHALSSWHADNQALVASTAEQLMRDAADHIVAMASET